MRRRSILTSLLFVVLTPAWSGAQTPRLEIVTPQVGALVEGLTRVSLRVDTPGLFSLVRVFVDTRLLCERIGPPYECEFDAGRSIVQHQVRVVGVLRNGGPSVVQTIETGDLSHTETAYATAVQVPVLVMRNGRFVRGLPREAFKVFEEGRPQAITAFAAEDTDLEVVVAIDVSASVQPVLPRIKEAVKVFLGALPETHQVTLLGFNGEIFTLASRERDNATRLLAVDQLSAFGTTALYDVVLHGLDLLAPRSGRKALVIFSDGEDRGSAATLADVEKRAQQTDAAIYTVGMGRGNEVTELMHVLSRIADPTGGRALQSSTVDRLRETFRQVIEELAHQYMLAFVPETTGRKPGEWRRIRVEVEGHRVRAKEGYFTQEK